MKKNLIRPSNLIESESQFGGKQVTLRNSKQQISGEDAEFRRWASFNQFGMEHQMLKGMFSTEKEKYSKLSALEQSQYFYCWMKKMYEKLGRFKNNN